MSIDITIALSRTDLPEPVVPATSKWGRLARSTTIGLPSESRPKAHSRGPPFANGRTSAKLTAWAFSLGISIPTREVPGIGAKIRTDFAASESAMSSSRLVILLTRSPSPIEILNVVTEGPAVQPTTWLERPNSSSVAWSLWAVASSSSSLTAEVAEFLFDFKIVNGGNSYDSSSSPGLLSWLGVARKSGVVLDLLLGLACFVVGAGSATAASSFSTTALSIWSFFLERSLFFALSSSVVGASPASSCASCSS